MRIDIVTLFPEMCETLLGESIIGRARARGHLQVCCHQLRRWGEGAHKRVDDCTFGGGKGMLLMGFPGVMVVSGRYWRYCLSRPFWLPGYHTTNEGKMEEGTRRFSRVFARQ